MSNGTIMIWTMVLTGTLAAFFIVGTYGTTFKMFLISMLVMATVEIVVGILTAFILETVRPDK